MPKKSKKAPKKAQFEEHHTGFIYPPDPLFRMRRRVPKATLAIYDQAGLAVDIQDEFGMEPKREKLLPSYYYEQEEEEDPIARKFHVLGKGGKIKRYCTGHLVYVISILL